MKRIAKIITNKIQRLLADQDGQALVEYALIIAITTGVFFMFFLIFSASLGSYYANVVRHLALPFP